MPLERAESLERREQVERARSPERARRAEPGPAASAAPEPEATEPVMSQVTVTINGRQFRMACEDGQEPHLLQLAQNLDERIAKLRTSFGEIGDTRLTVMAALTIADELQEANSKVARGAEELAALQDARVSSAERAKATQAAICNALNAAAERIEQLSKALNQTVTTGTVPLG
jgi:cell division protein ZapA